MAFDRAMVVHSDDGLDEISLAGPTHAWLVDGGAVTERKLSPADFGLATHAASAMAGGDPAANAGAMRELLDGAAAHDPTSSSMNAAAALCVAGTGRELRRRACAIARDAIASGRAREVLDHYIALTQEARQ